MKKVWLAAMEKCGKTDRIFLKIQKTEPSFTRKTVPLHGVRIIG